MIRGRLPATAATAAGLNPPLLPLHLTPSFCLSQAHDRMVQTAHPTQFTRA